MEFSAHWPTWNTLSEVLFIQLQKELDDQTMEQVIAYCAQTSPTQFLQVIDISKYSSLQKLLAVTAYVLRFITIAQKITHSTGHLTPRKWLHHINVKHFPITILQPATFGVTIEAVLR